MPQDTSQRILIVGGTADKAAQIAALNHSFGEDAVDWTDSAEDAKSRLGKAPHPYVFALLDRDQDDWSPQDLIRFVRQEPSSPFPALALALIGNGLTAAETTAAIRAGCVAMVSRPVPAQVLSKGIRAWPLDNADFIVCGAYVGPDRRRIAKFAEMDRRLQEVSVEQTISSKVPNYDIAPDATLFRFKRFAQSNRGLPPAVALRDGLPRAVVAPAQSQVAAKKREALGLLDKQADAMNGTWQALESNPAPRLLGKLNGQAVAASDLSAQRGLVLMSAVTRSMAKYSAGGYRLGRRLVGLLRVHLDGINTALRHRIDDDGGPVGRNIIAALKDAERRFREPLADDLPAKRSAGD